MKQDSTHIILSEKEIESLTIPNKDFSAPELFKSPPVINGMVGQKFNGEWYFRKPIPTGEGTTKTKMINLLKQMKGGDK